MIVYSKGSGYNDATLGKIATPIKMVIEHESDLLAKKGGICDWLFNVEKSSRFGETIVNQSEFSYFRYCSEGSGAELDTVTETSKKFIEHIQFMKEFIVTAEMMEDAGYGISVDAKRRAESFTRAYYRTMNKICESALTQATIKSSTFAGAPIDLSTADGMPLFSNQHSWGSELNFRGIQSNFFWGDIFKSGSDRSYSTGAFEEALAELSVKMRNFYDESGIPLGYTADTIILPGNRPIAETIAKKVCGSAGTTGNGYNDINLQFGNWNVIVMPAWQSDDDRVMIMSSEANRNLSGNMFFNRVPLTITSWVDHHTGNYVWNGRCRFGIGFGSYKHIILAVDSASAINGADQL